MAENPGRGRSSGRRGRPCNVPVRRTNSEESNSSLQPTSSENATRQANDQRAELPGQSSSLGAALPGRSGGTYTWTFRHASAPYRSRQRSGRRAALPGPSGASYPWPSRYAGAQRAAPGRRSTSPYRWASRHTSMRRPALARQSVPSYRWRSQPATARSGSSGWATPTSTSWTSIASTLSTTTTTGYSTDNYPVDISEEWREQPLPEVFPLPPRRWILEEQQPDHSTGSTSSEDE